MKILLVGTDSTANLGDQAILICMMDLLRERFPDAEFVVLSHRPHLARERLGERDDVKAVDWMPWTGYSGASIRALVGGYLRRRIGAKHGFLRWMYPPKQRHVLRHFDDADLVALVGGRYLTSPYFDSVLYVLHAVELARTRGIPVVSFPQSIGPFVTAKEKFAASLLLSRIDYLMVRDERTRDFFRHFQVKGPRIDLVPDCVFTLEPADNDEIDAVMEKEGIVKGDRPLIAVTARTLKATMERYDDAEHDVYMDKMAALLDDLSDDADLVFLSSTYAAQGYFRHDPDIGRAVASRMHHGGRLKIVDNEVSAPILKGLYGRMDAVITTRMHPIIMSSAMGVPVAGIAYEYKSIEVLKLLGFAENAVAVRDFEPEAVAEIVRGMLADRSEISRQLLERTSRMQTTIREAVGRIPEIVR